jgi:hypothetical protein
MLNRLGMPISRHTPAAPSETGGAECNAFGGVRLLGVDDWPWKKGATFGTIVVDLERSQVVDVLPTRSALTQASGWRSGRNARPRDSRQASPGRPPGECPICEARLRSAWLSLAGRNFRNQP